jgi:hypothetical protein
MRQYFPAVWESVQPVFEAARRAKAGDLEPTRRFCLFG